MYEKFHIAICSMHKKAEKIIKIKKNEFMGIFIKAIL